MAVADSKAAVDGRRSAVRRSEKVAATLLSCRHLYPRGMMGNPQESRFPPPPLPPHVLRADVTAYCGRPQVPMSGILLSSDLSEIFARLLFL